MEKFVNPICNIDICAFSLSRFGKRWNLNAAVLTLIAMGRLAPQQEQCPVHQRHQQRREYDSEHSLPQPGHEYVIVKTQR